MRMLRERDAKGEDPRVDEHDVFRALTPDDAMSRTQQTIVIADDEAPIRLVVGDKLRSAGYRVFDARDGEEALDLVRLHLPSGIVTDLQMPYMNGVELCMALKADPTTAEIPALLLTARGHVLTDDILAKTNIRKVMSKPFGVRDLLAYVQNELVPASPAVRLPAAGCTYGEAA